MIKRGGGPGRLEEEYGEVRRKEGKVGQEEVRRKEEKVRQREVRRKEDKVGQGEVSTRVGDSVLYDYVPQGIIRVDSHVTSCQGTQV